MDDLLTTQEVCKILKMSRLTLAKLAKEKKIPAFKVGRMWKFEKKSLDDWIQKKITENKLT